jgi:acetyl esterase/lipase
MRRLALVLAVLLLGAAFAAPAGAKVRPGPAGDAFYQPPDPLTGKHGQAIWARNAPRPAGLSAARRHKLLLYRSTGSDGSKIAVSGSVLIPKGKAPRNGWPVITYAHGSTGIADRCAPSRSPRNAYNTYVYPLLNRWLKAKYVVVRTDYQGLGTPGTHEYLIGVAEGRSTLDIARAARAVHPGIGTRIAIAGHSQGGHAALWAAALARRYTPDLKLRGTVAFAPASHISEQLPGARAITEPGGGLSGIISIILRGIDVAKPGLGVPGLLTDRASALYPETLDKCLSELGQSDSWGGLAPAEIPREDADLAPLSAALDENDPENLNVPGRLLLAQGTSDSTVFKVFTDQLDEKLRDRGTSVAYKTYRGVGHGDVVKAAATDSTRFINRRFGRRR